MKHAKKRSKQRKRDAMLAAQATAEAQAAVEAAPVAEAQAVAEAAPAAPVPVRAASAPLSVGFAPTPAAPASEPTPSELSLAYRRRKYARKPHVYNGDYVYAVSCDKIRRYAREASYDADNSGRQISSFAFQVRELIAVYEPLRPIWKQAHNTLERFQRNVQRRIVSEKKSIENATVAICDLILDHLTTA